MISGLNPPPPPPITRVEAEDDLSMSSSHKDPAHRLLRLIRLVEKEPRGETYESCMEEAVELMNSLIVLYSRRGLLQGNTSKAEKMLASISQGRTGSHSRKRGSSKNPGSERLQLSVSNESPLSDSSQVAETLIFTALTRIFAESEESRTGRADDSSLLLALGAELCVSMVQHIEVNKEFDHQCAVAEYEMLALSAKSILSGLTSRMQSLADEIRKDTSQQGGISAKSLQRCLAMAVCLDEHRHISPVLSSLRAACALVKLFRTKLSRSTALLIDLRTVAWNFVTAPNHLLQDAAGRLLAALPLVGGTDRKTPTEMWTSGFQDILYMISNLAETIAPVGNKPSRNEGINSSGASRQILEEWIAFFRQDISSDRDRALTFVTTMKGLVLVYQHFLSPDLDADSVSELLEIKLDTESILEVVEWFMSYPMAAESLFFRTTNRLRDEVVEGGLISPRIIATRVANEIKQQGHEILDFLIKYVGGPALLPHARRIVRVSYASLLTSCSGYVRKAMDPSSVGQLQGKKRRWLHLSMILRTSAVETVQSVIVAFGSDRTAKFDSLERAAESKSDGEMAVTLVAGCLLEQIGANDIVESVEETWGTLAERVALIIACLDCLRAALSSINGFLGMASRSLIESMVVTCLSRKSRNTMVTGGDPFLFSSVQSRILQLSSTCLSTPWNDGAASSIVRVLKDSALKFVHDGDKRMSQAAMEALRVCDLFGTPRAPPLLFVHRTISENAERFENLAPKAVADIQSYQEDSRNSRVAAEDAEKCKQQEKRLREQEKEECTKRKRLAREVMDESTVGLDAALKPTKTPQLGTEPENILVETAGSTEAQDERQEVELAEQEDHTYRNLKTKDPVYNVAPSGGEDFLDIEIMADDGPDSDDD